MSVYVGIDVHRKRSEVAVIDQDGRSWRTGTCPTGRSRFEGDRRLATRSYQENPAQQPTRRLPGHRVSAARSVDSEGPHGWDVLGADPAGRRGRA